MDMADVEHLSNDELLDAVISDIRCDSEVTYLSSPSTSPTAKALNSREMKRSLSTASHRRQPNGGSLDSSMHSETISTDSRASSTSLSDHHSSSYFLINDRDDTLQITAL